MQKRILARCHQKGGQGVAIGALLATFYHFIAFIYIALSGSAERVFSTAESLTGTDAFFGWHMRAIHALLSGGQPPERGSEMWGDRLGAIFGAWLAITLVCALIGGAIGLAWALRPGHHHGRRPSA